MKTDILPLEYGLGEVMQMHPVRYNWKENPEGPEKVGLIAQEVQALVPEVVLGSASGEEVLGMNYGELVPVLINAMQEQQSLISQQQEQLKQQQSRMDAMQAELEALKAAVEALKE